MVGPPDVVQPWMPRAARAAKALGRKGKPVVVATGTGTAKAAGKLTVKLRLNSVGKKKLKRLKGTRLTLRIVQGGRTTTKTVTLR